MAAGEIVTRSMTGHATSAMTEHDSHVSIGEKAKAKDAAIGGAFGVGASVEGSVVVGGGGAGLLGIAVGVGAAEAKTPRSAGP